MDSKALHSIERLKHQESIKINGKVLYRTNDERDFNEVEAYWQYDFYDVKNKRKNPLATHQVRVHVAFEKNTRKARWVAKEYVTGDLLSLTDSSNNRISSLEN